MVLHTCDVCGYQTPLKQNFAAHKRRKNPCKPKDDSKPEFLSTHPTMLEAFQEIRKIFNVHQHMCGPTFIEICVSAINKKDIGRPSSTPLENKLELINYLSINT